MLPRDAAGGIITRPDGKVVLVWQNGNSWSFPKGGIDKGETPFDAAVREIQEETGLTKLTFVEELGSYKRHSIARSGVGVDTTKPESTRTLFLFTTNENALVPQDNEVSEARWVSIDEAKQLLSHPLDAAFLESKRKNIVDAGTITP